MAGKDIAGIALKIRKFFVECVEAGIAIMGKLLCVSQY